MNRRELLTGAAVLAGVGQAQAFGLGKMGAKGGFGGLGSNGAANGPVDFLASNVSSFAFDIGTHPPALYDSVNNKTWVSYLAYPNNSKSIETHIVTRNHAIAQGQAGDWTGPYVANLTHPQGENHGVPALCGPDADGYMYHFGGPHNQAMQVSRSKSPNTLDNGFIALPEIAGRYTYPHPVMNAAGNKIYLFMRQANSGNLPLALRVGTITAGSIAWAAERFVINWGSGRVYAFNALLVSGEIWFGVTRAPTDDSNRTNHYFFKYVLADDSIKNFSGGVSVALGSQPVDNATTEASFKLFTTTSGNVAYWCMDSNSKPHMAWSDGPVNGPYTMFHSMSNDGSTWIAAEQVEASGNVPYRYDGYCITPAPSGAVDIYWADGGTGGTINGNIAVVRRSNAGAFGAKTVLTTEGNWDPPMQVQNGIAELRTVIAQTTGVAATMPTGTAKIKGYGDSGFVKRSPAIIRAYSMQAEFFFGRSAVSPSGAFAALFDNYLFRPIMAVSGLWDQLDGLYSLRTWDRGAGVLNLRKGQWDLVEQDSANLTFVANSHFAGNGSTAFLKAPCAPQALIADGAVLGTPNLLRFIQNEASVFGYVKNLGDAKAFVGFHDPTNFYHAFANINATQFQGRINVATTTSATTGTNGGVGFVGLTRTSDGVSRWNVNGTLGTDSQTTFGTSNDAFYLCGLGAAGGTNRQCSLGGFGRLTLTQQTALQGIIAAFMAQP